MYSNESRATNFIGRQLEMAVLDTALDDALSGRGRFVMLAGEPGIGKTRIAQELAALAERRGARILWGWCYEREGAPPYWPWLQCIRTYIEAAEPDQLSQDMGTGAADISEILPELMVKLEDLERPPVLEPEQARFRLFFSITTFLKNLSLAQPLVLVLDDLHWADESSLLLLEFLAREISANPILVIATYRDVEVTTGHPLAATLGNLVREQDFQRVQLGGLSRQEVGEFVEAKTGVSVPDMALDTLYQRTDGNPLFVSEVVGSVSSEEIARDQTWIASIPEAVREAILRRTGLLSETCNQLLRTAAVIGREFDHSLLQALNLEISEDSFLDSLDEAIGVRIIEPLPEAPEGYRFGHALIQQAVYEEVSPLRRAQTHKAVGETLELLHQNNLDKHAGELAYHFARAGAVGDSEKLVRYSLMAGEGALASHAYKDAHAHFERGLASRDIPLSGAETVSDDEAAALLFGLARAQSATLERHRLGEVFSPLSRAFEYYAEAGNIDLAVATAAFPIAPAGVLIPGLAPLMARALALAPVDSHEAGRLLSRYGGILGAAEGDYEGAQEAMKRAIAIARREGDVALEVQTLTNACDVNGRHLHWKESVDNGVRAIDLLTGDENPYFEVLSRFFTALGLLNMGDLNGARIHALALLDLTEQRVTGVLASLSFAPIIYLSCLEGNWKAGREYSDRILKAAPLDPILLLPRILLEHETGESAQGEVYLELLLPAMHQPGPGQIRASGRVSLAIATIARITDVPFRLEIAEEAAEWILSKQSVAPGDAMPALAGLALLPAQEGGHVAAKEHYAYLLDERGTMISPATSVDRLLGHLSQTMGNLPQAVTHFEDALAFCRKAGYKPDLAWTCHDYADLLLRRHASGDGERARCLLNEALAISSELDMKPLMKRLAALQENADSRPEPAPAYPDGLTAREVEVLLLIAEGKTTREIAGSLVLSGRTVQRHISNLYSKIDVRNRVEATAFAQNEPSIASQAPESAS